MIKACPDDCTFDWEKFHKDLNTALDHFTDPEEAAGDILISQLWDFVTYSNQKRILSKKEGQEE